MVSAIWHGYRHIYLSIVKKKVANSANVCVCVRFYLEHLPSMNAWVSWRHTSREFHHFWDLSLMEPFHFENNVQREQNNSEKNCIEYMYIILQMCITMSARQKSHVNYIMHEMHEMQYQMKTSENTILFFLHAQRPFIIFHNMNVIICVLWLANALIPLHHINAIDSQSCHLICTENNHKMNGEPNRGYHAIRMNFVRIYLSLFAASFLVKMTNEIWPKSEMCWERSSDISGNRTEPSKNEIHRRGRRIEKLTHYCQSDVHTHTHHSRR